MKDGHSPDMVSAKIYIENGYRIVTEGDIKKDRIAIQNRDAIQNYIEKQDIKRDIQ